MPRLTDRDYCCRRTLLTVLYEQRDSAFIGLTTVEQRALHDYYVPSLQLEPAELKTHRRAITKLDPTLPQRAGRAWAHLEQLQSTKRAPVINAGTGRVRHIRALGVIRPEPDYDKFTRALLSIARDGRKM